MPKNKPCYDQFWVWQSFGHGNSLLVGIRLFINIGTCFYSRIYEKSLRFYDTVKDKISIQMNK